MVEIFLATVFAISTQRFQTFASAIYSHFIFDWLLLDSFFSESERCPALSMLNAVDVLATALIYSFRARGLPVAFPNANAAIIISSAVVLQFSLETIQSKPSMAMRKSHLFVVETVARHPLKPPETAIAMKTLNN